MRPRVLALLSFAVAMTSLAISRQPSFREASYNYVEPRALRVAASLFATPDVSLDPVARPGMGGDPPRIGIVRNLPLPYRSDARRSHSAEPSVVVFRSSGASRIRLHLTDVKLADRNRISVIGSDGYAVDFGAELVGPEGDIWTPSVAGDTIALSFHDTANFVVSDLGHIFGISNTSTACLTDVSCSSFSDRETFSKSIAQLTFFRGNAAYVCSGGLINGPEGDRLFLTANHCISTQSEASSLELAWDLRTTSCANSSVTSVKRTNGATLVVGSASTDVSLLRLGSLPSGRWLMGWDTARPTSGTTLYRISHPYDDALGLFPQVYSATIVSETTTGCTALARPNFLYSLRSTGGTAGGSSGAPVITEGGYIVGQLYGLCGLDPQDGCSSSSKAVDGALGQSYPLLQPFLKPQTTQCGACAPGANTGCLLGNRFKVTLTWKDLSANLAGAGGVIRYAENTAEVDPQFGPMSESVFFSMYSFAPRSIEVLVRMISGRTINDKYWVFVTGFTGAEYTVSVQDTRTCASWQRTIASGATDVTKDFNAFPFP